MHHNLPIKIKLPAHFLDEETRDGYTISPLMKKVWAVEIDLLFEFIRICEKYELRWYMGGGSMLGAVRHKGYIPWDDDIDLNLFRKDYDKFCEVAKQEIKSPYFFTDGTAEKGVFRAYAQIYNSATTCIMANNIGINRSYNQGLSIDIFPIDNIPDSIEEKERLTDAIEQKHRQCHWLYGHNGIYISKNQEGFFHYFKHIAADVVAHVFWPFAHKKWPKELFSLMKKYQNEDTTRMIADLSMPPFLERRLWEREWYAETVYLPFEWFAVPVPSGYKEWLTKHYGNWQHFEKGTALHLAGIYDPERPYTEYIK